MDVTIPFVVFPVSTRFFHQVVVCVRPVTPPRSANSVCFSGLSKSPCRSSPFTSPQGPFRFLCRALFPFPTTRAKPIHRRGYGGLRSRKIRQHPCYPTSRLIVRLANCRQPSVAPRASLLARGCITGTGQSDRSLARRRHLLECRFGQISC